MNGPGAPLVVVAAGGTGGHLFPAEALASALSRRGMTVDLVTDARAWRYGQHFPARRMHIVPSATVAGRNPVALARAAGMIAYGTFKAWRLLRRLRPAAVVGFGGYPTIPPVLAATLVGIPTVLHEQNAVMGRANRFLAARVKAIATSLPGLAGKRPDLADKVVQTGNPVRPAVIAAAAERYDPPGASGPFHLLVFGGSQGARVMADVVPAAIALLPAILQSRIRIIQQARGEDRERVEKAYAEAGVNAEVAPFFGDLPARIARAHIVVSRSGASTVAELAAIGRPAILVPFPHALDQDQLANATVLKEVEGAIVLPQEKFTPERLAAELAELAAAPHRLTGMAAAAKGAGTLDAAERLADLVAEVAGVTERTRA